MAKRPLARLGLDEPLCAILKENGVANCGELLRMSPLNLMSICNISYQQAITLQEAVSVKVAPSPISALAFLQERRKSARYISSGFQELDDAMKGGLLLNSVTDICGAPGIGKTQFCLTCVVQHITETCHGSLLRSAAESSSSDGGCSDTTVVYIDAELKLDPSRIIEIAIHKFPSIYSSEQNISAPHHIDDLLDRIKIFRPNGVAELEKIFAEMQSLVIKLKAKLIVIDSIAAIVRRESWDEREKESFLLSQSQFLKLTADQCRCAILATNQITPASGRSAEAPIEKIYHEGNEYLPTLGRTWYHCVTTRLVMTRPHPAVDPALISSVPHVITIQKSPLVALSSVPFSVQSQGLVHASESMEI